MIDQAPAADLVARAEALAQAHDREARALDNEYPEPDAFCTAAGGDGARATTACLRELVAALAQAQQADKAVTRFEVIDDRGRVYVVNPASISVAYQDGGRTLKVFVEGNPNWDRAEPRP